MDSVYTSCTSSVKYNCTINDPIDAKYPGFGMRKDTTFEEYLRSGELHGIEIYTTDNDNIEENYKKLVSLFVENKIQYVYIHVNHCIPNQTIESVKTRSDIYYHTKGVACVYNDCITSPLNKDFEIIPKVEKYDEY